MGFGGVSAVARATGISRLRICRGIKELKEASESPLGSRRIRKPGGGRKKTVDTDLTLKVDLEKLVQPTERGEPENPLRWTCKSVRRLAKELKAMGHQASHRMVAELLHELGYSLQANSKTLEVYLFTAVGAFRKSFPRDTRPRWLARWATKGQAVATDLPDPRATPWRLRISSTQSWC
jgi:transposase